MQARREKKFMLVQDEKWAPLAAAWAPSRGTGTKFCLVRQQRRSGGSPQWGPGVKPS